jgi:hypothetical protein
MWPISDRVNLSVGMPYENKNNGVRSSMIGRDGNLTLGGDPVAILALSPTRTPERQE